MSSTRHYRVYPCECCTKPKFSRHCVPETDSDCSEVFYTCKNSTVEIYRQRSDSLHSGLLITVKPSNFAERDYACSRDFHCNAQTSTTDIKNAQTVTSPVKGEVCQTEIGVNSCWCQRMKAQGTSEKSTGQSWSLLKKLSPVLAKPRSSSPNKVKPPELKPQTPDGLFYDDCECRKIRNRELIKKENKKLKQKKKKKEYRGTYGTLKKKTSSGSSTSSSSSSCKCCNKKCEKMK